MSKEDEIFPKVQHNSFILPVEEHYEFVERIERQVYENDFQIEFLYDQDGNCTIRKFVSKAL